MPKPISWADRVHAIRERTSKSKAQTYTRQDLESLFEVKRVAAQNLMKLIGGIHAIGPIHVVESSDLLAFLDRVIAAPSVATGVQECQLYKEPAPRVRPLRRTLPTELRSVMCRDLPTNVELKPGELRISGQTAEAIFEGMLLLAQAVTNDLDTAVALLEPQVAVARADTDELRELFARLEEDERASRTTANE